MTLKRNLIIIAVLIFVYLFSSLLFGTRRLAEKGFDFFVNQTNHLSMHSDSVVSIAVIKSDSIFLDIRLPKKAGKKTVKVVLDGGEHRSILDKQFEAFMNNETENMYPIIVLHKNILIYAKTEVFVFFKNKDEDRPVGYYHNYFWFFLDWVEIGSDMVVY